MKRHRALLLSTVLIASPAAAAQTQDVAPPTITTVPTVPSPPPEAREVLEGEAARQSEYAAEAVRFARIIHTGTLAEIRAAAAAMGQDGIAERTDEELSQVVSFARAVTPDPDTFAATIDRVVIRDNEIEVSAPDGESRTRLRMPRRPAPAATPPAGQ